MRTLCSILIGLFTTASLLSQEEPPCQGGSFELIKPIVGNWKEFTITPEGEVFIGTLKSKLDLDGCVLLQRFESEDGSFSYQSFGYVAPSSNTWKEIYVFNNGRISKYEWEADGTDILMRRTGGTRKISYLHRLRLTNINEDFYDVIDERSEDGGKRWKQGEVTRIKRVK